MPIVFESKEIEAVSDSELERILKRLNKKRYIYISIVNVFMAIMLVFGILLLFYKTPGIFIVCVIYFVEMFLLSKNNVNKFRKTLFKLSNYVFDDEFFYVNDHQLNYSDIYMLEVGVGYARIRIQKYKLIVIFENRDSAEIDMLVTKLRSSAKRYKEV